MALLTNGFTGKLNLDTQAYRIPQGDYIDAINITRDSESGGQDIVVAGIQGNTKVNYPLPAGTNKCIGQYPDKVRNRVYIFIWNSNDFDSILYYDRNTDTIYNIIQNIVDTYGDILDFDPSKRINHVDIIYRDLEGDMLFFTDGNSSPKKLNVETITGSSLKPVKKSYIELAKAPPLTNPISVYGTDTARNSNSLRRSLFMFTHRWRYDDFEKSSFSTYSKIALPIGYYGSDNDIDNTNNNFITVTVQTGDINVTDIEIAMRQNNSNLWNDFVQIAVLNKAELGIASNTTYDFLFYNDALYPPIPLAEQQQLFDWVPQEADCQVLGNGNIPIYSAITEGYDNYPVSQLQVTITAQNHTNIPPDADPPAITYVQAGTLFTFTVQGTVPVGTQYTVAAFVNYAFPTPPAYITLAQYTSIGGDTVNNVATGMYTYIVSHTPTLAGGNLLATFGAILPTGSSIIHIDILTPSPGAGDISTEKTWLYNANYVFGLVYVDEQNRDMPGVTTFASPVNSDIDFVVTTPSISFSGTDVIQTPVITATINHTPPEGAVAFYWVRRRQTYGDFLFYMTCDFQDPSDGFLYFCLANIEAYKAANSQFNYATAPINPESRIKILAEVDATSQEYDGTTYTEDYQILGTVIRTLTSGSSPDDDKTFIKVKKPSGSLSNAYSANMVVMVYTPFKNPTDAVDSVYWEWGESFQIYEFDGHRYHRGSTQDQNRFQEAIYTWEEGDVYFHERTMYGQLLGDPSPTDIDTVSIMDAGFSDFFPSSVNDNGRGQVIESNALRLFNPTLIRFGNAYQSGTSVSGINRFYFENFDEYDRSNGSIKKMFIEGRRLYCFQQFDIGVVPVLTQVVENVSGNPLQANSQTLLNKIAYPYVGKFGIGDVPESFAYGKNAKYGIDNNKGVVWRLSNDGVTPLSILYECNSFFVEKLQAYSNSLNNGYSPTIYTGNPTVYGAYNDYTNRVIWCLEEITRYANAGSMGSFILSLGLNDIGYLLGEVSANVIITFHMHANNGDNQTATYTTTASDTLQSLTQTISAIINATPSTLFTGTPIVSTFVPGLPLGTNYFGVTVHDIANSGVTLTITFEGMFAFHQDPYTISFNESRKTDEGFESFYSYHAEAMGNINNLLYSFKNGYMWTHDSDTYCNFYDEQFGVSITPMFAANATEKKTFIATTQYANKAWPCTEIRTQLNSFGSTPQRSRLVGANFANLEGNYNASFMRDENSQGGWINGDALKGAYISVKCEIVQAPDFTYINGVLIKYIDSPLNIK